MLAVVLVIYDGAGSTVNDICKLLLRQSRFFPCSFYGKPYIVKIQPALVSFNLHYITQCNFIFRVIVFERLVVSCNALFNFMFVLQKSVDICASTI